MNRIALATEELFRDNVPQPPGNFRAEGLHPITAAVVYGAGHIAAELDARLIVVASHTGATALALSKQRNYVPTVGISDSPETLAADVPVLGRDSAGRRAHHEQRRNAGRGHRLGSARRHARPGQLCGSGWGNRQPGRIAQSNRGATSGLTAGTWDRAEPLLPDIRPMRQAAHH